MRTNVPVAYLLKKFKNTLPPVVVAIGSSSGGDADRYIASYAIAPSGRKGRQKSFWECMAYITMRRSRDFCGGAEAYSGLIRTDFCDPNDAWGGRTPYVGGSCFIDDNKKLSSAFQLPAGTTADDLANYTVMALAAGALQQAQDVFGRNGIIFRDRNGGHLSKIMKVVSKLSEHSGYSFGLLEGINGEGYMHECVRVLSKEYQEVRFPNPNSGNSVRVGVVATPSGCSAYRDMRGRSGYRVKSSVPAAAFSAPRQICPRSAYNVG